MPLRRRAVRRTVRRTSRRVIRRGRRRRVMVGGMVLLAAGGTAAAIKMSQKDAARIEQHTNVSVEELTDDELAAAMKDLGIKSIALDENDQAVIAKESGNAPAPAAAATPAPTPVTSPAPPPPMDASLADEIERLADLRDRGVINEQDFEAAKKKLLGL